MGKPSIPEDLYGDDEPPDDLFGDDEPAPVASKTSSSFLDSVSSYIPEPVQKGWEVANKPLVDYATDASGNKLFDPKAAADYYDVPTADDWRIPFTGGATWKGLGAGMLEGAGNVVAGLSSPLNLATMGTMKGASSLAETAPTIARGLGLTGRALSAPVAAHGALTAADPNKSLQERLFGGIELAGGAAGVMSPTIPIRKPGVKSIPPEIEKSLGELTTARLLELEQNANQRIKNTPDEIAKRQAEGIPPEAPRKEPSILDSLEQDIPQRATRTEGAISRIEEQIPPEMMESFGVVDEEGGSPNASGESAASVEALSRQQGMRSRGETYIVYDKAGVARNLVGPEAVDYQAKPGEVYGIKTPRGFVQLDNKGGNVPPQVPVLKKSAPKEYPGFRGTVPDVTGLRGRLDTATETSPINRELTRVRQAKTQPPDLLLDTPETPAGPSLVDKVKSFVKSEDGSFDPTFGKGRKAVSKLAPEEDVAEFAKQGEGKVAIGADIKSLGKVLGTSLYKGDINTIATKELIQNSLDAIRHLGAEGKVDIKFRRHDKSLEVIDNGKGLTRAELESIFTDLGSSGKRSDAEAIGGFGLAKAAPLLGGEKSYVESVALYPDGQKRRTSFGGTPDELLEGVDIHEEVVAPDTPTGTTVRVWTPEKSTSYEAMDFIKNTKAHSEIEGQIRYGESNDKADTPAGIEFPWRPNYDKDYNVVPSVRAETKHVTTISGDSANVTLSIPKNYQAESTSTVDLILMNKGMYQGRQTVYLSNKAEIPPTIIANIDAMVPEGHTDYPFTANRESLRGTVEEDVIKYINENIVEPSRHKGQTLLQKLYDEMPTASGPEGLTIHYHDTGQRYTKKEISKVISSKPMQELGKQIQDVIGRTLKVMDESTWTARLERSGIIFDDKLRGIHIPNPNTHKSAILINPLQMMSSLSPDEAAAGFVHTLLHEIAHVEPGSGGHNESFTIRLGNIYEKFGARETVKAQDNFVRAVTNGGDDYTPEVQKLLQEYTKSRGRPETKADLLTGTGIFSKSTGEGQKGVPSGNRPTRKGTTVNRSYQDITPDVHKRYKVYDENDKLIHETTDLNEAHTQADVENGYVKDVGEKNKINSIDKIKKFAKDDSGEFKYGLGPELPAPPKPPKKAFTTPDEFGNEIKNLADVAEDASDLPAGAEKDGIIRKTNNAARAQLTTWDLSAPGRQGKAFLFNKAYWTSLDDMIKAWHSEGAAKLINESITEHPSGYFKKQEIPIRDAEGKLIIDEETGLPATKTAKKTFAEEMGLDLAPAEEAFNKTLGDKYKKYTGINKAGRAHTAFLNKLRSDQFVSFMEQSKKAGRDAEKNPAIAKQFAEFINNGTGRGSLNVKKWKLERNAGVLSDIFFAPKNMSGQIRTWNQVLNPYKYYTADPIIRKQALKSLFAIAGVGLGIGQIAKLGGVEVSADPTNTDFAKLKFGDTRVDLFGGYQQFPVAAMRMLTGQSTSSTSGRTTDLTKGKFGMPSRASTAERFFTNRLGPVPGFVWAWMSNREFDGKPFEVKKALFERVMPIAVSDMYKLAQEDPKLAAILSPLLVTGMAGTQTYTRE